MINGAASIRAVASRIARLLYPRAAHAVTLNEHELLLCFRSEMICLPRSAVTDLVATRGLLWDQLRVVRGEGAPVLRVCGLPRGSAAQLSVIWSVLGQRAAIAASIRSFRGLQERDGYFNHAALARWCADAYRLESCVAGALDAVSLPIDFAHELREHQALVADAEQNVATRNDEYVVRQKERYRAWFDQAEGRYALTEEQREAILRDEDNCLVVAGAGTGKTSTVAAKVGFLLHSGAARPEQILLLTFTRKAAAEIEERVARLTGERVTVRTFHALGLDIVSEVTGKRPSLTKLAEDQRALHAALTRHLHALFDDPATRVTVVEFFAYHVFPYRDPFSCATAHEYHQYVRSHELRTLRGERVRSHEELSIANWLHVNGISYEYEREYPHDVASVQYRQYRPDFYLPEHDIYIEHFGIGRNGRPAPFIDSAAYRERMEWKRRIHERFGTTLVETYSYQQQEGRLLQALEAELQAHGITSVPRPAEGVRADLQAQELNDPVAGLVATFLGLFKGNLWTLEEVEAAALDSVAPQRARAFLRIFREVYARYEQALREAGEIDLNDMIAAATAYVNTGRYISRFTHIVVDEYQDLSRGRARLLKALLGQVRDRRLFCVGDDWQSIYRFTGSDVALMTQFQREFGFTHQCPLTRTYRFSHELLQASSHFVQANPAQLRKKLTSSHKLGLAAIEIHASAPDEAAGALLHRVISDIERDVAAEGVSVNGQSTARPSVLVLARYRHVLPRNRSAVERRHPALAFRWLTVHAAKGLEADYAIVLDVTAGRFGFPSEIVDDPLLDLLLAERGRFANAEERRLFYVAMTRVRARCIVLTDRVKLSTFVEELGRPAYKPWVIRNDKGVATPACPVCIGGTLLRREGAYGAFWGCSNYPLCEGKARMCPACGEGALMLRDRSYECSNHAACPHSAPLCPECGVGALVERSGPYGRFLGCSEWRAKGQGPSCTFVRPLTS